MDVIYESLIDLIVEYTNLVRKKIELIIEYNKKIGPYALDNAKLMIEVKTTEKKIKLLERSIESNTKINYVDIEKKSRQGMKDLIDNYDNIEHTLKLAEETNVENCSKEKYLECESLYKSIIVKLHPIFINDYSKKAYERFTRVKNHFIDYKLNLLEKWNNKLDDVDFKPNVEDVLNEMASIKEKINMIKNSFPFDHLDSKGQVDIWDEIEMFDEKNRDLIKQRSALMLKEENFEPVEGLIS